MSDSLTKAHDEDDLARYLCQGFVVPLDLVKTSGGWRDPSDVIEAYAKMQDVPLKDVPQDLSPFGKMNWIFEQSKEIRMPKKKPVKPTPEEIKKEIETLKDYKTRVRPRSGFGDDNVASIEAQIVVMSGNLDDDEIYKKYDPREPEEGEPEESRNELDNALEARRWMDGEGEDESPSEGWKPLLTK